MKIPLLVFMSERKNDLSLQKVKFSISFLLNMRDVILCQAGLVIVIKSTINETTSLNCYFSNSQILH